MAPALISLSGIGKDYASGGVLTTALKTVSFDIQPGEFTAIMGPSGSGKSTLLNILGCLDSPTRGTYHLAGENTGVMDEETLATHRSTQIGFVFQNFNLLQRKTSLDNIGLPLVYAGVGREERRQRSMKILERIGLERLAHSRPTQMSGGQQQRIAIARALVHNPQVILADEPTGNLDRKTGDEIMALFAGLHAEGVTIIIVTHDRTVAACTNRLIRIEDGEIIFDGHPHNRTEPPI